MTAGVPADAVDVDAFEKTSAVAWAFWKGWRGPPEMVAHVARTVAQVVADGDRLSDANTCVIELHVGDDVERFSSAQEFTELATADGLRRFSRLHLTVDGSRGTVNVEWNTGREDAEAWYSSHLRRPGGRPLPRRVYMSLLPLAAIARLVESALEPQANSIGVWLAASGPLEADGADLRDAVASSIERCTGRQESHTGVAPDLEAVEDEIQDRNSRTRDWPQMIAGALALVSGIAGAIGYTVWAGLKLLNLITAGPESVSDLFLDTGDLGELAPAATAASAVVWAGITLAIGARWIVPRIEVASVSRWKQALTMVYRGVVATVVAVLVSNGVRLLLGA